jgi:hypothetical protein
MVKITEVATREFPTVPRCTVLLALGITTKFDMGRRRRILQCITYMCSLTGF